MSRPSTLLELFGALAVDSAQPFLHDGDGKVAMTYGSAARRAGQFANALAQRGVRTGDRVAVQAAKSPEHLLVYLACVRAGFVLLPINTAYTTAERQRLLDDAQPAILLDDAALGTLVTEASTCDEAWADVQRAPDDLAAILYTSGTTGVPKGAMLSQRNLASNAATLRELWGFTADDVLLHVLPIFHTHGLFVAINCSIANCTPMVFLPAFDLDEVVAALPRCTVMMGVPTHYSRLLGDGRIDRTTTASVRLFISGSAPLPAATHAEFIERTGHPILERYGMTETSMITSNPLDGERRAGTVGFALPGVEVRLDNAAGSDVGGIEVRGPNVFAGYWHRPELNATEFTPDGFFRTGDLGSIDADGYLHIVGRSKDLIISGGLNVYPIEVEHVLDGLPGVRESAVIGVADEDFGEAVVAVVVADAGVVLDADDLRAACRTQLAGFKVPKRVHVVDDLPRNAMGKVEKARLRAEHT